MGKVLVVDDDSSVRQALAILLERHGDSVNEAASGSAAIEILGSDNFDAVITDLRMEEMSGLDLLQKIRVNFPEVEVILLTAYGSIQNAVEAMRAGAFDYVTKPFKNDELLVVLEKALERRKLVSEVKFLREMVDYKNNFGTIVGQSRAIRKVIDQIAKVAPTDTPVLINGAYGTGKGLMANSIHCNSLRRASRFVKISTRMTPENDLERQLVGYVSEKGRSSVGTIELVDRGTLLIDDVGDLSKSVQDRLLQLLANGTVSPIGSSEDKKIDVRVVAATRHRLARLVEKGRFSEDLYAALSGAVIELPRLRDRGEDILILAEHFAKKYTREFGKRMMTFAPEAARALLQHPWEGEVRELENAIRRTVAMTNSDQVRTENLILVSASIEGTHTLQIKSLSDGNISLEEKELEYIVSRLRENGWNCTKTAKELGIGRTTLWRKMKKVKEADAMLSGSAE